MSLNFIDNILELFYKGKKSMQKYKYKNKRKYLKKVLTNEI